MGLDTDTRKKFFFCFRYFSKQRHQSKKRSAINTERRKRRSRSCQMDEVDVEDNVGVVGVVGITYV